MRATIGEADLAQVIDETMGLAAQALNGRRVEAHVSGPRPMPVRVDGTLLGQAVMNLVLNAAQMVKEGGSVWVKYGPGDRQNEAKQLWLTVEDNGPGIPGEIMDRIFDPFFTTRDGGTGLGLAIVHRIVEAHEGAIRASNRPDGGARFEIRI
jgi:signal transduction histidine kinase